MQFHEKKINQTYFPVFITTSIWGGVVVENCEQAIHENQIVLCQSCFWNKMRFYIFHVLPTATTYFQFREFITIVVVMVGIIFTKNVG